MRFLTRKEWEGWCSERGVPLREAGWVRPAINSDLFYTVEVPYPADSGRKVAMARFLLSLVQPQPETLLLIDDWAVWPSNQHAPLFMRFRQALGERRELIEAPGHLISASDSDNAISIIATSLLFVWDCYGISTSGRDAFYISHDEFCFFGSRDESTAAQVAERVAAMK
jgi:hypothetical protein